MSYSVGGVGICHADTGTLQRIIREVAEDPTLVPQAHAPALLRLADGNLYTPRSRKRQRGEVTYDQIRAAGLCSGETFDTDLLGEPFRHFPDARVDCTKYKNPNLNASDWRVFRTWMRAALRRRTIQERLVTLWLEKYWNETLARVPKGAGYMEEAFVNVRVRNSNPSAANRALERKGANAAERVQRQLDEYGEVNLDTLKRRCRLMLRPVVLFRHFAGEPPLRGVACPRGAD